VVTGGPLGKITFTMIGSYKHFKSFEVDSFDVFLKAIKSSDESIRTDKEIELIIFRGQSVDENLLPRIGRKKYDKPNKGQIEQRIFDEFKRLYLPHIQNPNLKDWDILALAQHYFLPTRLLDWTENPLVALWFAFYEEKPPANDRVVWCFGFTKEYLLEPNQEEGLFEHKKTIVFKPRHITQRLINQTGWFTSHFYSQENNRFSALNNLSPHWKHLHRISFSNKSDSFRKQILKQLNTFGINSYSIFPDMEGLCYYLEWKTYFQ
jgi:hypothetical protein